GRAAMCPPARPGPR
ncbi:MAG TPA: hypothetical protein DC046_13230, partial [Rhodospirillaceae bacterium]|nr:hypothetical protein [Rhodospirillaceae bacterium]